MKSMRISQKYIEDEDVIEAIGDSFRATYVVTNWLKERRGKPEYKLIKTAQVLQCLKRLEKQGRVRRVTDSRNPYAKMLVWERTP